MIPGPNASTDDRPALLAVAAAFGAVYLIWGSTYLAIRYAVETIPPLTMAGVRFLIAGTILYGFQRLRGVPRPEATHWRSAAIVGSLLLLGGNGLVCWAEQWVASGITALLVATVSLWMIVVNWIRPGGVPPTRVEAFGLLGGFVGVAVLINPFHSAGSSDLVASFALVVAALLWASGSIYARHCPLPRSALMATALEMLAGAVALLAAGAALGEWSKLRPAEITRTSLIALAYLILFGSLIAFSAYIWILQISTPARVSTYAYVNPVVAVLLGWLIADEPVTARTLVAAGIIVASVLLITTGGRWPRRRGPGGGFGSPGPASSEGARACTAGGGDSR